MTRDQLEHAIRAACDVAQDKALIIFGSQAILGSYPEASEQLRASVEVDVQARNFPERTEAIDGALGELSLFHKTHGFYVHGLSIEAACLPVGWQDRTVDVCDPVKTRGCTGHCLEAHDLAASKLAAFRDKDRVFVSTLLLERLVRPEILMSRIALMPLEEDRRERLTQWVRRIREQL